MDVIMEETSERSSQGRDSGVHKQKQNSEKTAIYWDYTMSLAWPLI